LEWQSEGVQVVEWVGLVAFSFQFFTRLSAVFAEEVGSFFFGGFNFRLFPIIYKYGPIKRCFTIIILRVNISTFSN